jgi:hypothetical protein
VSELPEIPDASELPELSKRRRVEVIGRALLTAVTAILAIATVGLLMVQLQRLGDQTERLTEIAEQNKATGDRIRDSTTPGGQCYQEGNSRTGTAIASINQVTIAAVSCANRHVGDAAIRVCVAEALKAGSDEVER